MGMQGVERRGMREPDYYEWKLDYVARVCVDETCMAMLKRAVLWPAELTFLHESALRQGNIQVAALTDIAMINRGLRNS